MKAWKKQLLGCTDTYRKRIFGNAFALDLMKESKGKPAAIKTLYTLWLDTLPYVELSSYHSRLERCKLGKDTWANETYKHPIQTGIVDSDDNQDDDGGSDDDDGGSDSHGSEDSDGSHDPGASKPRTRSSARRQGKKDRQAGMDGSSDEALSASSADRLFDLANGGGSSEESDSSTERRRPRARRNTSPVYKKNLKGRKRGKGRLYEEPAHLFPPKCTLLLNISEAEYKKRAQAAAKLIKKDCTATTLIPPAWAAKERAKGEFFGHSLWKPAHSSAFSQCLTRRPCCMLSEPHGWKKLLGTSLRQGFLFTGALC